MAGLSKIRAWLIPVIGVDFKFADGFVRSFLFWHMMDAKNHPSSILFAKVAPPSAVDSSAHTISCHFRSFASRRHFTGDAPWRYRRVENYFFVMWPLSSATRHKAWQRFSNSSQRRRNMNEARPEKSSKDEWMKESENCPQDVPLSLLGRGPFSTIISGVNNVFSLLLSKCTLKER